MTCLDLWLTKLSHGKLKRNKSVDMDFESERNLAYNALIGTLITLVGLIGRCLIY